MKAFDEMLTGKQSEAKFHGSVEWIWNGNKEMWWIRARLGIPVERQAACMYLGKEAVRHHREALALKRERVYTALSDNVAQTRMTSQYGEKERKETLKRRVLFWWIAELTAWGSSDVAAVYNLLAEKPVNRQVVDKQLDIIHAVLANAGIARARKKRLNAR